MSVQQFDFTLDVQRSLGLPRGPFVLYSDYAKLRAEVGRLEKKSEDALRFASFLTERHPFDFTDHVTLPGHGWRKLCGMLDKPAEPAGGKS